MAWVRLEDGFPDSPKALTAGPAASYFYVCALAYCSRMRTAGFIPASDLSRIASPKRGRDVLELARRLVDSGLWDREPGGFRVRDYVSPVGEHPIRAAWNAMRARIAPLIFARDGYRCLLCGARNPLTVDHDLAIVRGGTNDLTNLRTLCRPCNSRKGAR